MKKGRYSNEMRINLALGLQDTTSHKSYSKYILVLAYLSVILIVL